MDCAEEYALITKGLAPLSGVVSLHPDYLRRRLSVEFDPHRVDASAIEARLEEIGFPSAPTSGGWASWHGWTTYGVAASLVALLAAGLLRWATGAMSSSVAWLAVLSVLLSSPPVARAAWRALRLKALDMNVLMTIAAGGALLTADYFEAATAMFLFRVALWLEGFSLRRAQHAVRSLVELEPAVAHRVDENGAVEDVAPAALAVGDRVLVKPGERLPVDGVVASGTSGVNQAPITGESLPVEVEPGDRVFAGSINGEGVLDVTASETADRSTLAHIARLVEQAQRTQAPTERFVNRFARRYTPSVIVLAVLFAVVPPLAFGQPALEWLHRGLVLLVIACPCALVISTPVTIVSGLHAAARRGLLVKGGGPLEDAGRIDVVAFDKTGTLTTGEVNVVRVLSFEAAGQDELLRVAASLESHSEHPLAQAIVAEARSRGLEWEPAVEVTALRGFGLQGTLDGETYYVGNRRLFEEQHLGGDGSLSQYAGKIDEAATVALVGTMHRMLGAVLLADRPRVEARSVVAELRRSGVRSVVMLTGDSRPVAEHIAAELGIDVVFAELLPQEKVEQVGRLMAEHPGLAMVGDGVNDAPALVAAHLGIALGSGASDTALETCDVAVTAPRLGRVVELLRLGRRCRRLLGQNIALALAVKGAVLALAAAGLATMWMAVAADVGASMLVIFNGMRLLNGVDKHE